MSYLAGIAIFMLVLATILDALCGTLGIGKLIFRAVLIVLDIWVITENNV